MNFCTKCASYYQQPGTCNCYTVVPRPVPPLPVTPGTGTPFPRPPYEITCGSHSGVPSGVWYNNKAN